MRKATTHIPRRALGGDNLACPWLITEDGVATDPDEDTYGSSDYKLELTITAPDGETTTISEGSGLTRVAEGAYQYIWPVPRDYYNTYTFELKGTFGGVEDIVDRRDVEIVRTSPELWEGELL